MTTRALPSVVSFATRLESGGNNIDLLRLSGAVVVLFVHSFVLTGVPGDEPTAILFGHGTDLGTLVVGMFFVFSGFLVTRSALRLRFPDYARARVLRLYPALVMLLLLQTFALGAAMTTLPPRAYIADFETWRALLSGLLLSPPLGLPGLFPDTPVPFAVNGSLWTLRFEAAFWAMLAVLAPLGLLGRRGTLLLFALATAGVLPAAGQGLKAMTIASYLADFLAGAALYAWRDAIPHRPALATLAAFLLFVGCWTPAAPLAICLTLPYCVMYLGLTRPVLRLPDDISYGAYLYAFPIQQTLVALLDRSLGPWSLTVFSLPPTIICGILSRRLIEHSTQRHHRAHGDYPRTGVVRLREEGSELPGAGRRVYETAATPARSRQVRRAWSRTARYWSAVRRCRRSWK